MGARTTGCIVIKEGLTRVKQYIMKNKIFHTKNFVWLNRLDFFYYDYCINVYSHFNTVYRSEVHEKISFGSDRHLSQKNWSERSACVIGANEGGHYYLCKSITALFRNIIALFWQYNRTLPAV